MHGRVVDRTLHRGLRFTEHRERLFGQQDVVEGLFDFGRQRDARRTRRFDGRGHLLVVHLHHAVNLRREERHRSIHGPAERRIGVVAQREALGHLLHDEAVVDLPGHRHLRQQAAPCLAFHIVVALHLHLGDLDGGILAQRQVEGLVEREAHLRHGSERTRCREAQCQNQFFHSHLSKFNLFPVFDSLYRFRLSSISCRPLALHLAYSFSRLSLSRRSAPSMRMI